ncbi:MAG TPA: response regulator [Actinocrinis sp.]|jgi:response regulator of citrate/malate metabolism|uniref:response regulator n=1 Tax=Actinocrinis sp. TaxID=1920516 RepID=UPI002DDC9198|nr:response regulator [Actinocrinis sp.]HEV3169731.1 response regulator [Actinocrinis sp.]
MTAIINTLIVEDDPVLAQAHSQFAARVPGFTVVGVAHLGAEALRMVATRAVDVLLLDVNLPDVNGIELCRALRARGNQVDVIAVTSARDLATVRAAVSLGVVQYLVKPFSFATFQEKLQAYAEFRRRAAEAPRVLAQDDVDRALAALHEGPARLSLPKGLTEATLATVTGLLRGREQLSAAQAAAEVGISVQTARRYLEYLAMQRLVSRTPVYGGAGRPVQVYRWAERPPPAGR